MAKSYIVFEMLLAFSPTLPPPFPHPHPPTTQFKSGTLVSGWLWSGDKFLALPGCFFFREFVLKLTGDWTNARKTGNILCLRTYCAPTQLPTNFLVKTYLDVWRIASALLTRPQPSTKSTPWHILKLPGTFPSHTHTHTYTHSARINFRKECICVWCSYTKF